MGARDREFEFDVGRDELFGTNDGQVVVTQIQNFRASLVPVPTSDGSQDIVRVQWDVPPNADVGEGLEVVIERRAWDSANGVPTGEPTFFRVAASAGAYDDVPGVGRWVYRGVVVRAGQQPPVG